MEEAAGLLGRPYMLRGEVVVGDRRGRTIGFPTANVCTENELVPPHGVYATTAILNGVAYPSISNIGTRPTFETGEESIVETHLLDFDEDLYGAGLRLAFVQRLRDEKKFEGVDPLKKQIEADRDHARDLFGRMGL